MPSLHLAVAPVGSVLPDAVVDFELEVAGFAAVAGAVDDVGGATLAGGGVAAGAVAFGADVEVPLGAAFCTPP